MTILEKDTSIYVLIDLSGSVCVLGQVCLMLPCAGQPV